MTDEVRSDSTSIDDNKDKTKPKVLNPMAEVFLLSTFQNKIVSNTIKKSIK